jgi:hypothetical protein
VFFAYSISLCCPRKPPNFSEGEQLYSILVYVVSWDLLFFHPYNEVYMPRYAAFTVRGADLYLNTQMATKIVVLQTYVHNVISVLPSGGVIR